MSTFSQQKTTVKIVKINNTWGVVLCDDPSVIVDLHKKFSVKVENYFYMPKYKAGIWDGKVKFVKDNGRFYNGLLKRILTYLGDSYDIELDSEYKKDISDPNIFKENFIKLTDETLTQLDPYVYQWRGAVKSSFFKRGICEHATGSGKSYTITMVCNYFLRTRQDSRILILVPKIDLVEQFCEDMVEYGISKDKIGKYCGYEKDFDKQIVVSTWQSIYKKTKLLRVFNIFLCDECHSLKSTEVSGVGERVINCDVRLGFTGTLPEALADRLLIEGVLGPVLDKADYEELQKHKTISPLEINVIKLLYPDSLVESMRKVDYQLEKAYIEQDSFRNNLICKVINKYSKEGKNCLILVKRKLHGDELVNILKNMGNDVFYVNGDMKIDVRTEIRKNIENQTGKIIVATIGVYSTGISINNLHVLGFASAGKSKIQTLQSVGRGLRKHISKDKLLLFDFCENLKASEEHTRNRIRYYKNNKFDLNIREVIVK